MYHQGIPQSIMVGSTIGKYRIVEQLGKGGMGTVYKAIDETLDREVAIKVLNAELLSEESLQRFRSEAVLLAKLSHARIAGIYELTRHGNDLLMVMEYVRGETCEKLLARSGPMPIGRAVLLCDQILDALEHAHASGIVHRDLKPGNVMVTASGDVKVMDFGIARMAGSAHLTMDGYMMGTPAYMAPEQVRGEEVDQRMDLYSATVMLYRLLTSRLPFEAESPVTLIHSQLSDPPTPPRQFRPDLPDWIDAILARGLAKSPGDRFQTAAEFRQALDRGFSGMLAQVRPAFDENAVTMGPTPTPTALRRVGSLSPPVPAAESQAVPFPTATTPKTEATVTLRRPQLAMAGGLLVLLVIAVGILAYAALRRPFAGVAPNPTSQVAATQAAPAAAGAVPAPVEAPQPATPPAPASASTSSPSSGTPDHAGQAGAVPPAVGKTAIARSNASSTPAAGASGSTAAADASGPAATRAHASAVLPPESFGDLKTLVPDGAKTKEIDALLNLESNKLVVRNRDNGAVVQTTPYRSIAAATYAHGKGPRWQDGTGMAAVPKSFSGSGFFLKTSKHWLTLQSKSEFVILRLEDKNVRAVMASVEARTGLKVQRSED